MTSQTFASEDRDTPAFAEHARGALDGLRGTIIDLLSSIGADPSKPQDLARRLGITRNLAWKVSKIAGATDPYTTVPHVPGPAGLRILFRALESAGAPTDALARGREAASELDRVVDVHTGDRTTLEIMVGDMLPAPAQSEHHEHSRKLAFQGNSGSLGVRARVQLSLNILAPNADDPDRCDLAQIGGLVGFRRLRREARWLLFRRERWTDDAPQEAEDTWEPIADDAPHDGIPLIPDFCSTPQPEIEVISGPGEVQVELPPGPVGNAAALTCIYGAIVRSVGPAHGEQPGEYSEIGCNLTTPTEHFQLDLLVHRDFEWAMRPELMTYSRMDGGALHATARRERNLLPVPERVHDLAWRNAALATPLIPRYTKLIAFAFEGLGWNADDFRAFRVTMQYPPIPASILLRSELPVREG